MDEKLDKDAFEFLQKAIAKNADENGAQVKDYSRGAAHGISLALGVICNGKSVHEKLKSEELMMIGKITRALYEIGSDA